MKNILLPLLAKVLVSMNKDWMKTCFYVTESFLEKWNLANLRCLPCEEFFGFFLSNTQYQFVCCTTHLNKGIKEKKKSDWVRG